MKQPRVTIGRLMVVVAGSALVVWGLVRFPRLDHTRTSIVLGVLLGSAFWVVPLAAVRIILHFKPRWYRLPVEPDPPDPE